MTLDNRQNYGSQATSDINFRIMQTAGFAQSQNSDASSRQYKGELP